MSETYKVVHIHEQGNDMILVLVSPVVGSMANAQKQALLEQLQACATVAGLRGHVVLAWQVGQSMQYFGPAQWTGFLRSFSPALFAQNINRTLTCG